MMIQMLFQGQVLLFVLLLTTIVISLSCHEFGHAWSAKLFGDNTAQQQGRLTMNPIAHIDPMGLLMIIVIGFGWARPVPTNPANFNSFWATLVVAAAGHEIDPIHLLNRCAEHLARYKVPRRIFAVDELPKTSVGKIRRRDLDRNVR